MAGTTEFRDEDVITVGLQGALGYQLGPVAVELEHERGLLLEGQTGSSRGNTSRSAVNARLFAPDITQVTRILSPSTILRLYLEAGLGRSHGSFGSGEKFARLESSVGGGFILDHRNSNSRPQGIHYVGWHVGWSLRMSEPTDRSPSFSASCKAGDCPAVPSPSPGAVDLNLMFISSLNFGW